MSNFEIWLQANPYNEWLLALGLLVCCSMLANAITNIVFGKGDRIEQLPHHAYQQPRVYTTDIIPNENTVWLTHDEFFGKPTTKGKDKG